MLKSIGDVLGDLENKNFVLLVDNTVGRTGLFNHHFIGYGIKNNRKVVVLGLDQSFGHYHSVGLKLGLNLMKARDTGSFHHIDGSIKILNACLAIDPCLRSESGLQFLLYEVAQNLSEGVVLVLDNLTILTYLGFSIREINLFIQKLLLKIKDLGGLLVCTFSTNSSVELVNYLTRLADIAVVLEDLKTGKSRDVSGHMTVKSRLQNGGHHCTDYQFRLEDRNVKIFAPGTSAAVL